MNQTLEEYRVQGEKNSRGNRMQNFPKIQLVCTKCKS